MVLRVILQRAAYLTLPDMNKPMPIHCNRTNTTIYSHVSLFPYVLVIKRYITSVRL